QERGVTPVQLAIAWVRAKGEGLGVPVIPTIGARTRRHLDEALGALELTLSDEDVRTLEAAVPADAVAGSRYPEALMAHLDSERTASQRGVALASGGAGPKSRGRDADSSVRRARSGVRLVRLDVGVAVGAELSRRRFHDVCGGWRPAEANRSQRISRNSIPAARAAAPSRPLRSPITRHSEGRTPRRSAARRYPSGDGFRRVRSGCSPLATTSSIRWAMPRALSLRRAG